MPATDEKKLDDLCHLANRAETKNGFHACRLNHPLGRDNEWKWRNAYALASQDSDLRLSVDYRTMDWLKSQSANEAKMAPPGISS